VPLGPARASDFSIGPDPFSVAVDAEANALWVSDFQSGEVLRVAVEPAPEASSTPAGRVARVSSGRRPGIRS
jgi:hypothetical protein